ncbi:hypothetical protein ACHQM5_004204 [Ranunculus cassubicifolius]
MGQSQSQTESSKPTNVQEEQRGHATQILKTTEVKENGQGQTQNGTTKKSDIPKEQKGIVPEISKTREVKAVGQGQSEKDTTKANNAQEEQRSKSLQISHSAEVKEVAKLPYNYENIIKDADSPINIPSTEKLYDHLYSGVFLNQNKKKYWVDKETGHNCFMLYARDLSITWAEENRYWNWSFLSETSDLAVFVAELLNVCWLEIHGKFDTTKLTPKTMYEVLFIVKLHEHAYGWETPVNIRLTLPSGGIIQRKEALMTRPRGEWITLEVGEIYTSPDKMGEMEISMFEYEGGKWKSGLIIKGIVIRPKKQH